MPNTLLVDQFIFRVPATTGLTRGPVIGFVLINNVAPMGAGAAVVPSTPRVTVHVVPETFITVIISPVWPGLLQATPGLLLTQLLQTKILKLPVGTVMPLGTV